MKKVTVKIPAKLNLTLDVTGAENGYHNLNSLVASISLYDVVTVKKRKDNNITITERGISCDCQAEDNNAYKSAKLFLSEFNTTGVDIIIDKSIPVGNGLGGSSADIVGVLLAMKKLYGVNADVTYLAERLGSDTVYMMRGGYAVMSGRGEKITPINFNKTLYILLISSDVQIPAGKCFSEFDKLKKPPKTCTTEAVELFIKDDIESGLKALKNDLFIPATTLCNSLEETVNDLIKQGAKTALMTGSGSCCYGVFLDKREMNKSYKKLKGKYGKYLIKTKTLY